MYVSPQPIRITMLFATVLEIEIEIEIERKEENKLYAFTEFALLNV